MTTNNTGKFIIIAGFIIVIIGVIWYFFGDKLSFIGRLPGDMRIERENFSFYFPVTTMILLSVVLSLIARLFRYFID